LEVRKKIFYFCLGVIFALFTVNVIPDIIIEIKKSRGMIPTKKDAMIYLRDNIEIPDGVELDGPYDFNEPGSRVKIFGYTLFHYKELDNDKNLFELNPQYLFIICRYNPSLEIIYKESKPESYLICDHLLGKID
jgi:hypothetical protein